MPDSPGPTWSLDLTCADGMWYLDLLRQERKYARRLRMLRIQAGTAPLALKLLAQRVEASKTTPPYEELR